MGRRVGMGGEERKGEINDRDVYVDDMNTKYSI
jgi:hypothetical protein